MPSRLLLLILLTMSQPACAEPPVPETRRSSSPFTEAPAPPPAPSSPRSVKSSIETPSNAPSAPATAVLSKGGTSLDAVVASVVVLEDCPLFNAGKGAVFTHDGRHELDASIMDGSTRKAGAVAGVSIVKNPITAARAVMDHSPHVLLVRSRCRCLRPRSKTASRRELLLRHPRAPGGP